MSKTHLQRRGCVYYYRRRVPQDLVSKFGKKVIQYSLQTSVLSEAKKRCAVHDLKTSAKFEHLRQSLSVGHTAISDGIAKPAPLSELEIVRLVQRYVAD